MRSRLAVTAVVAGALAVVPAAAAAAAPSFTDVLTIRQDSPTLHELSMTTAAGESMTLRTFTANAAVTKPRGTLAKAGTRVAVTGSIVPAEAPSPSGTEARLRTLVFSLKDGSQLTCIGASAYPASQPLLRVGEAQRIPCGMGSGRFSGLSGEVRTVRAADGSYAHVISLRR